MSLSVYLDTASRWLPPDAFPDRPDFGIRYPWRQVALHSHSLELDQKEEAAIRVLDRAASRGDSWRVGLSCGKDSSALSALLQVFGWRVRGMSVKDDLDYPGEREYLAHLLVHTGLDADVLTPPVSLRAYIRESKMSLVDDMHSRTSDLSRRWFYSLIDAHRERQQYTGIILGLRAAESKGRKSNVRFNGTIYDRANGEVVAQPLATWTAIDVHAYLYRHGIPPLPVYMCADIGCDPWTLRKSWWICGHAPERHYSWLRRWWPNLWHEACLIDSRVSLIS